MKIRNIFTLVILIFLSADFFAQTNSTVSNSAAESSMQNEKSGMPLWLKDVRDTEIIMLGSLPFVTLGVTLGYSFVNFVQHDFNSAYFVNPFTKEGSFTQEEQIGIIVTSSLICAGIGLTNLTINLIKRGIEKKNNRQFLQDNIKITVIENEMSIMPVPQKYRREKKYLYGNMESAVF